MSPFQILHFTTHTMSLHYMGSSWYALSLLYLKRATWRFLVSVHLNQNSKLPLLIKWPAYIWGGSHVACSHDMPNSWCGGQQVYTNTAWNRMTLSNRSLSSFPIDWQQLSVKWNPQAFKHSRENVTVRFIGGWQLRQLKPGC